VRNTPARARPELPTRLNSNIVESG
jgi:hypothetical protein